jgi:uncharacterized membrane protein
MEVEDVLEIKLTKKEGKLLDRIFEIGVLIKALFGFFEICGGILISFGGHKVIDNLVVFITRQEIMEDPNDLVANYLIKLSSSFSGGIQFFAIFYLLFHGVVNILLAVALLRNKLWAYPAALVLFGAFLVYQIYRCIYGFSFVLLFLIIFDLVFILFILLEYFRHKKRFK